VQLGCGRRPRGCLAAVSSTC